ncbi:MAG: DUF1846 domain-containing protein [Ruminococcaceae bacterium]|nr:DUF1846 domain-containing protein [Oscillospiraceae bacterium]
MITNCFDNEKYISLQSQKILDRIASFGGKLYLEFGGKLFDDFHASRVLPGFHPDSKIKMLYELRNRAEIVIVISANDIEKNKRRGDLGITYDLDTLRLIDAFRNIGLYVGSVVITQYSEQHSSKLFQKRLENLGIKVYRHYPIENYPSDIPHIISEEGFGKNEYIETTRELVVITAPGPGSGKMATCLSQLYHEHKRGICSGYAKFETFPIWNLSLSHPVNLAYEAATADMGDVNMIDPYHLEAYGISSVNYNRDIAIFPVLKVMFEKIYGESPYKSPTDMGVNMVGYCIFDNEAAKQASYQEIIRRYYAALCAVRQGTGDKKEVQNIELIMNKLGICKEMRSTVIPALRKAEETDAPAVALELKDGTIITGKTSDLLGTCSAMLLNALKHLGGIDDSTRLLSPAIIEPIQKLKVNHMGNQNPRLHMDEVLIALAVASVTDSNAAIALEQIPKLNGTEAHSTVLLSRVDENVFKRLGVNLTCEPQYQTNKLFHG